MATITSVTIGFHLGASLLIDGIDWAKPTNHVSVTFDSIPDDEELRTTWDWIMDRINEQSDDLFEVVRKNIRTVPQVAIPQPIHKQHVSSEGAPPPGGRYD